jgi:hypothetical protein
MITRLATRFVQRAAEYRALAQQSRRLAIEARGYRRHCRIIDARHFTNEAAELVAAAAHSGWRLP